MDIQVPTEVFLAHYSKFQTAEEVAKAIIRDPYQMTGAKPGPYVFEVRMGHPVAGPVATLSEIREQDINSIKIIAPDGIVFAEAPGGLWKVTAIGASA